MRQRRDNQVGVDDGVLDGSASGFGEDRRYRIVGKTRRREIIARRQLVAAIGMVQGRLSSSEPILGL